MKKQNFVKHIQNGRGVIRYSSPQSKNWGDESPPPSPQDKRPWKVRSEILGEENSIQEEWDNSDSEEPKEEVLAKTNR